MEYFSLSFNIFHKYFSRKKADAGFTSVKILFTHTQFIWINSDSFFLSFWPGFCLNAQAVSQQWPESRSFQCGAPVISSTNCHAEPASTNSPVSVGKLQIFLLMAEKGICVCFCLELDLLRFMLSWS